MHKKHLWQQEPKNDEFTRVYWKHTQVVTTLAFVTILLKIAILHHIVCENILTTKLQNKTNPKIDYKPFSLT